MSGPKRRCRRAGRSATPICARAKRRCRRSRYQRHLPRSAAAVADRPGAGQQPRPARRRRQHRAPRASQYRIQRAELLPEVDAGAGATVARRRQSTGSLDRRRSGARTQLHAPMSASPAFELDLFGRVRSLTSAAQNRYFATEAAARATRLTLVGDIADAWLNYAADKSLLKIAQDTAASAENSVELTRAAARRRHRAAHRSAPGRASARHRASADLAQQTHRARAGRQRAAAAGRRADRSGAAARVDRRGGADDRRTARRARFQRSCCAAPTWSQAEYQLRAANAEIGAARAALFPRISLTGLLGLASNALTGLFSGGAFNWSGRRRCELSDLQRRCRPRECAAERGAARRRARHL